MIKQIQIKELAQPNTIPVSIPALEDVRRLAEELHRKGKVYRGQYKGWPVVYHPTDTDQPKEDWMVPFAASFQLGVWPLWSLHIDWENGDDQLPNIWTWDKNLKDIPK